MFHRHFSFDRNSRNAAIGRIVVSVKENCPEIDQCSSGRSISTGKYTSSSACSGPRRIQTIRATSAGIAMTIVCIISPQYSQRSQALLGVSLLVSGERVDAKVMEPGVLVSFDDFHWCHSQAPACFRLYHFSASWNRTIFRFSVVILRLRLRSTLDE